MTVHSPRLDEACDYIDGRFAGVRGTTLVSTNPARPAEVIWTGSPIAAHVDDAVNAARRALPAWANRPIEDRIEYLQRWRAVTAERSAEIAALITDEMGKVLGESLLEAKALGEKVNITLDDVSFGRVRGYDVPISDVKSGHCRFKPHGVLAVIGPFNFPAHLPNGHFVPALLTGNTIVFKPSEKTPAVGQLIAQLMHDIELPPGVFNVVQGGGDIASKLCTHDGIDGVLFTGSWPVGRRIIEANLDRPGRILALEMGGNNPAVVLDDAPLKQAVIECARSSFATTGQRCTCTRRLIVQRGVARRFISAFCKMTSTLIVGPPRASANGGGGVGGGGGGGGPVFMGPLVTADAVESAMAFTHELILRGGRLLVEPTAPGDDSLSGGYYITPGVVEVDGYSLDFDRECFGPVAQIAIVDNLDDAIAQANASRYGLAAAIFTSNRESFERFFSEISSGCINWNAGTAGASSKLPFGGTGRSGNHRPAGAFSCDYCAYPVANMVDQSADAPLPAGMQFDERWIA